MEKKDGEERRRQGWWGGWWESEYFGRRGAHEILIIRNGHRETLIGKKTMGEAP